jgi:hypothetical protein
MKKFWIVLLALGLLAGFAMSASAADVKFSGSYFVYGIYNDNPYFAKDAKKAEAYYQQRLRIQTEFKVAEGLSLVTRFDALEKQWGYGAANGTPLDAWRGSTAEAHNRPATGPVDGQTTRVQENIEFERAYLDFTTKIGRFNIGYQDFVAFGTMFANSHHTRAGIKYFVPVGPVTIIAAIEKTGEQSLSGSTIKATYTSADNNIYDLGAVFKFGAGDAGVMFQYADLAFNRMAFADTSKLYILNPYARVKFGPVYVEAEGGYAWGKWTDPTGAVYNNADVTALAIYVNARADLGMAYVGGLFAWSQGDNLGTTDKKEGNHLATLFLGEAWDPCLIMWDASAYGYAYRGTGTGLGAFFDNAYLFQVYGGVKPVKGADIMMSLSYAKQDQLNPATRVSKEIGWELDLVAKYKIFDNLEYMIGGAYLFAGDWFKTSSTARIDNNYMLIHKLTLAF